MTRRHHEELDPALLDRYLAGESSPSEDALVEVHFGDGDPRSAVRAALAEIDRAHQFDSVRAWESMRGNVRIRRYSTMRIAASILILLGAGVAVQRIATRRTAPAAVGLVASTGVGERRVLVLDDSTTVTLGPRSTLRYSSHFGRSRDVTLAGQASFSVTHDASRPFTVHTTQLAARVLGTEFDVRAYALDRSVEVVVASGRVQLRSTRDMGGPVLTARQLGHLDVRSGAISVRTNVQLAPHMGWRSGRLAFERAPLGDVLAELSRWFDVELMTDSVTGSRTVTTDVRVAEGASLDVALNALALTVDARVLRQGRKITIVPR